VKLPPTVSLNIETIAGNYVTNAMKKNTRKTFAPADTSARGKSQRNFNEKFPSNVNKHRATPYESNGYAISIQALQM
jgi:hypothetical protein